MAKKNLQSLMSGIIGPRDSDISNQSEQTDGSSGEQTPKNDAVDDAAAALKARPGRPKKEVDQTCIKATFVMPSDLLKAVKFICVMEGCMQKDVVAEALKDFVKKWESENGKIQFLK